MRNKLYYKIAVKGKYIEFHLSADREEAVNLESMSRRIRLDHEDIEIIYERWHEEIKLYEMISVR